MKPEPNYYEITNVPFVCYGDKIDDAIFNHYYHIVFTEDFGVFKKGETLNSIVVNFHKGIIEAYDVKGDLIKKQKFIATPIISKQEEIEINE